MAIDSNSNIFICALYGFWKCTGKQNKNMPCNRMQILVCLGWTLFYFQSTVIKTFQGPWGRLLVAFWDQRSLRSFPALRIHCRLTLLMQILVLAPAGIYKFLEKRQYRYSSTQLYGTGPVIRKSEAATSGSRFWVSWKGSKLSVIYFSNIVFLLPGEQCLCGFFCLMYQNNLAGLLNTLMWLTGGGDTSCCSTSGSKMSWTNLRRARSLCISLCMHRESFLAYGSPAKCSLVSPSTFWLKSYCTTTLYATRQMSSAGDGNI